MRVRTIVEGKMVEEEISFEEGDTVKKVCARSEHAHEDDRLYYAATSMDTSTLDTIIEHGGELLFIATNEDGTIKEQGRYLVTKETY